MMHGLDTGFLVAAEAAEHAEHTDAQFHHIGAIACRGHPIAVAPQVRRSQSIHIVTDSAVSRIRST